MLEKTSTHTYIPGTPGSPGFPGQPAHPAYTSVETICTPPFTYIQPIFQIDPDNPGEQIQVGIEIIHGGGCETVTVYHPAEAAIPAIPAVPSTPAQFLTDYHIGWNAGAYSILALDHDLQTTFRIAAVPGGIFIGLSSNPVGVNPRAIDYALYFRRPIVDVWERGALKWGLTSFTQDDDFQLKRIRGVVSYWKNGTLLYQSATPSIGPLNVDCSMFSGRDKVL